MSSTTDSNITIQQQNTMIRPKIESNFVDNSHTDQYDYQYMLNKFDDDELLCDYQYILNKFDDDDDELLCDEICNLSPEEIELFLNEIEKECKKIFS